MAKPLQSRHACHNLARFNGLFSIDAATGVITVADAAGLKHVKKRTVLTLFVSVWDGYQRSESGQVSIEVD